MGQNELLDKLNEIKELKALQSEIADQLSALEDTVKNYMTAQGTDKIFVGTHKVQYVEYEARRFDSKTFKSEHEELYAQYTKTTLAHRLTIS